MFRTGSISDLIQAPVHTTDAIVDVRPMAAYNGWILSRESRGGHIPGAVPFPVSWFFIADKAELFRLLVGKGVSPDKNVILYGNDRDDAETAASSLSELGFSSLQVFGEGLVSWADDPSRPMEWLPRYNRLIYPALLDRLQREKDSTGDEGRTLVVAHASFDNRDDYNNGHISGAINIPEYNFDKSNPVIKTIPKDKTIVSYCDGDDCEMSVKLADNLFNLGYEKVYIFFGGWKEWKKAGYDMTGK